MLQVMLNILRILCFAVILAIPTNCIGQSNTRTEITLLSYNAWLGGTEVNDGQSKALNAVLMSGADIAGISEATDSIGNILAERLGWYSYITDDNVIISRFPIKKTWKSLKGAGAEIEIANGKMITLKAVHLNINLRLAFRLRKHERKHLLITYS